MIIKNANVFKDDFVFDKVDVEIDGAYITKIGKGLQSEDVLDADGGYLIPGFIDIHSHGCKGYDTCDEDLQGYDKMSKFYASKGVTSFLFTTMSFSEEILSGIIKNITSFIESNISDNNKAYSHGIYLEGPFINPIKKGAQADKYIILPDLDMYKRLTTLSGNRIKVVAMAPELLGSMDFINTVSKECAISLAHTTADYYTATEAIKNGAMSITHLFNAMPSFNHREPGVIGAAFDSNVYMEMICDGIHLHPSVIRSVFKVASDDRVLLVSDSMSAAGMEDGKYSLGGQDVMLKGKKATLADGTIAGSATNIHDCIKNCISFGIPKESAIKAATINPAKLIGVDKITGSITIGKYGDLVLLDKDMNIQKVWIKGSLTE